MSEEKVSRVKTVIYGDKKRIGMVMEVFNQIRFSKLRWNQELLIFDVDDLLDHLLRTPLTVAVPVPLPTLHEDSPVVAEAKERVEEVFDPDVEEQKLFDERAELLAAKLEKAVDDLKLEKERLRGGKGE